MPLPFTKRTGTDPDAAAYFATAGIGSAVTPTAYDNASTFNGTNQYLSNSSFTQNGSFTLAFWARTGQTGVSGFANKGQATANNIDWAIFNIGAIIYFQGTSGQIASVSAAFPLNQWNFVVVTYNSTSLVKSIQVNNGTIISNTGTTTFSNTYSQINLSCFNGGNYLSGAMSGAGYWSRVLSSTEITALYNAGIGLTYSGIVSAGLTTNLVSYWALNQNSVTADSAGSNTLTNNGNVTASAAGPIAISTDSSRTLINAFVKGVKSLGLWNSVVCWPLRSSQNASTTLTAYSLGGVGSYNGTLVNCSTTAWTSTGLLNSATGYVTTGLYTGSTASHNFVVVNETANGTSTYYGDLSSSNSKGTRGRDDILLVGNGTSFTSISYSATNLNNFKALNYDVTASTGTIYLNGSSITSAALTGLPPTAVNPLGFLAAIDANAGNVGQYTSGTMAFYLWLKTNISSSAVSQLYTIYKQTLGQGLALP